MLRVLSQTLLGLILLTAGGYLAFVFLQGLADSSGTWAIFCAIPILVSGIFLLLRAGKSDATVIKKTKIPAWGEGQASETQLGFEAKLAEDNAMIKDWGKTIDTRNQLKVLQSAPSVDKP